MLKNALSRSKNFYYSHLVHNNFLEQKNFLIIFIVSQISIVILLIYLAVSIHENNLSHCLIEEDFYLQIKNLNKKILEMQSEKTSFLQQATVVPVVKTYYGWFTENSHIIVPVFIGIVCIGSIGIYFYYGKGNPPFPFGDDGAGTSSSGGSIFTSENVSTSALQSTLKGPVEKSDLSIVGDIISSNIGIEENIIKAAGGGTCDPCDPVYVTSVVNKITIKSIQGFEGLTSRNVGPDLFTCITHDTFNINSVFDAVSLKFSAKELDMWNSDHAIITQSIFTRIKDSYTENVYGVYTHMVTGFQPPLSFYETDWVHSLAKAISVSYLAEYAPDSTGPATRSSITLAISKQIDALNQIQLASEYSDQINAVILLLKDLLVVSGIS